MIIVSDCFKLILIFFLSPPSGENKRGQMYIATHRRLTPFCIGICLGYFMHLHKNTRVIISPVNVKLGWTLCVAIFLALALGPYHLYDTEIGLRESVWEGAIFTAFSKVAWSLIISWIIFSSHNGYGGFVNRFLSWNIWQPFARISYSLYVTHAIVIVFYYTQTRSPFDYRVFTLVSR